MRFIGADLHKKSITFCVVEIVNGKTVVKKRERLLCCQTERIERFFEAQVPYELTVESTIGYEWFADLCAKTAQRVVLAHAGKLRIIAQSTRKTDKIDAFVLAEFLAKEMIPEAWQPTSRVRQHRSLVRRRHKIQSRITSIKNTIHGLLTRYNADREDLFTRLGREASEKPALLTQERWIISDLWEEYDQQKERLKKLDARLKTFAKSAPLYEAEARAVLETIPNVSTVTVDVVLAELGDWKRFRNANTVASFAGLDPGVRESDGRRKNLKLSKAGSPLLRWVMIQLAHRMKSRSARWQRLFEQTSKRAGKKKATCALARRLLLVMYAMLRDGKAYQMPFAA